MRPRRPIRQPEVIRLLQGQRALPDASDAAEAEPVSQVRTVWPGREAILELFVEAQRKRA